MIGSVNGYPNGLGFVDPSNMFGLSTANLTVGPGLEGLWNQFSNFQNDPRMSGWARDQWPGLNSLYAPRPGQLGYMAQQLASNSITSAFAQQFPASATESFNMRPGSLRAFGNPDGTIGFKFNADVMQPNASGTMELKGRRPFSGVLDPRTGQVTFSNENQNVRVHGRVDNRAQTTDASGQVKPGGSYLVLDQPQWLNGKLVSEVRLPGYYPQGYQVGVRGKLEERNGGAYHDMVPNYNGPSWNPNPWNQDPWGQMPWGGQWGPGPWSSDPGCCFGIGPWAQSPQGQDPWGSDPWGRNQGAWSSVPTTSFGPSYPVGYPSGGGFFPTY